MDKLLNAFLLTALLTLNSEAIHFVDFNEFDIYNLADFRAQEGISPFPIIGHYKDEGTSSTWDDIRINAEQPTLEDLPEDVRNFIEQNNLQNIQIFEAYAKSESEYCNYFTHTWSMDRMTEKRSTHVSTGMFNANNLEPINGEIGINRLVKQKMDYDILKHKVTIKTIFVPDPIFGSDKDKDNNENTESYGYQVFHYLGGNVARFKISKPNEVADAWFISVYNPGNIYNPNDPDRNIPQNKETMTIIVHWYFFKEGMGIDPSLSDAIINWDTDKLVEKDPQMTPVE